MANQFDGPTKHIRLRRGESTSICGITDDKLILVDAHAQADCDACAKTVELNNINVP